MPGSLSPPPRGGVNATIGGFNFNGVISKVDVLAPSVWTFAANEGNWGFSADGGTSFAGPQIAGAALLFKDWMIAQGWGSYANLPGVIFCQYSRDERPKHRLRDHLERIRLTMGRRAVPNAVSRNS